MTNALQTKENGTEQQAQAMEIVSEVDMSQYRGAPIDRDIVREFADTLYLMHPAAKEVGIEGMRTVAQLSLVTGANPLPGTNGIHAWVSKGKICIQFGIGYWRGKAEEAGGVLWIDRVRPMTEAERRDYGVGEKQNASITSGALKADVIALIREMSSVGVALTLTEAKHELAQTGYAIADPGEYDKAGRNKQWTSDLRAERDLYRKLVPALVQERRRVETGEYLRGGNGWRREQYTGESIVTLPENYSVEDANNDLFGPPYEYDADTSEAEFEDGQYEDIVDELTGADDPPQPNGNGNGKTARPMPPAALVEYLRKVAAEGDQKQGTQADAQYTASALTKMVGKDNRHLLMDWLFGVKSTKDMSVGQHAAIKRWAGWFKDQQDQWQINPDTLKEAAAALRQAQLDAGQQELFAGED